MQKLRLSSLLFSTLLTIPALSWAAGSQTTTCSLNNQQRVIEVATSAKGCEVRYTKGSEQTKTLWSSARNEYCTKPAADFIEKQKSWGWSCDSKTADAADTTAAQ